MNKQTGIKGILAFVTLCFLMLIAGCDNSISNKPENELTASGQKESSVKKNSNTILCEMNLSFGKESMKNSRILESNIGTHFRNIIKLDTTLSENGILDLQEVQPNGIFALYLNSDKEIELSNSDGMNIRIKSILLEKCSFIDLKVKNFSCCKLRITGLVAGE